MELLQDAMHHISRKISDMIREDYKDDSEIQGEDIDA